MSQQSKSILRDLDIDPELMFKDPVKFQELCLANADYLFGIMEGRESTGDRQAKEIIQLAAKSALVNLDPNIKPLKAALQQEIFNEQNGRESTYTNEELAQIVSVLTLVADQIKDHIGERLSKQSQINIKSKRAASALYSRLRVLHDKWREMRKLVDTEPVNWKTIPGRPGNYKDNVPYIFYMFNGEEYGTYPWIVRCLSDDYDTSGIHNIGDFHDFVRANPDCGVRIIEA